MLNRRGFFGLIAGAVGGMYAAFVSGKEKMPVIIANGTDKEQKWKEPIKPSKRPGYTQVHDFKEPIVDMFTDKDRLIVVTPGSVWACEMDNDNDFKKVKIGTNGGNLVIA